MAGKAETQSGPGRWIGREMEGASDARSDPFGASSRPSISCYSLPFPSTCSGVDACLSICFCPDCRYVRLSNIHYARTGHGRITTDSTIKYPPPGGSVTFRRLQARTGSASNRVYSKRSVVATTTQACHPLAISSYHYFCSQPPHQFHGNLARIHPAIRCVMHQQCLKFGLPSSKAV